MLPEPPAGDGVTWTAPVAFRGKILLYGVKFGGYQQASTHRMFITVPPLRPGTLCYLRYCIV